MRIAFVGLRGVPAAYSGVERAVEEIGCRLASRGHDITVFCMSHHFERRPVTHRGMLLKYVPSIRSNSLEMITHAFLATLSTLTGRYDVMHFHALGPSTLSFLPRLFGKQTVVTVHGLDWKREKWGALARAYLRFGEAASCRFPDATIVVSEVLRDHYAAKYEADTVYIPNGVPTSEHKVLRRAGEIGELRAREYILFVGRLTPEKNVHQLIRRRTWSSSAVPATSQSMAVNSTSLQHSTRECCSPVNGTVTLYPSCYRTRTSTSCHRHWRVYPSP